MTLPTPSDLRALGLGQVRLPRLGFGAAVIGNLYQAMTDEAATGTVREALAAGLRYFDTAPHYGFGLSEARLGAAFRAYGDGADLVISSKVGRVLEPVAANAEGTRHGFVDAAPFEPVFDYSYDGVMRSYESSLARLGVERIDVLLAHDLGRATHGADHERHFATFMDGGYRAMRSLRDSGAVGAIGLGVNEWQVCEQALAAGDFDVFLLAGRYTLLEQTALDSFLPLCERRNVSIILGGPYNSGILIAGVRGDHTPHYNYAPAPARIIDRVARLETVCEAHGVPLAAAALQFPMAHPRVASVIPGMRDAAQIADALRLMDHVIPDALWSDLRGEGLLRPDAPVPSAGAAA